MTMASVAALGLAAALTLSAAAPTWTAVEIDGRRWSRLKRLHARHERRGLTIIGVSLDRSSAREFRSWLQRLAIGWPQVREAGGFDAPLARTFGIDAVPASFGFGRHGGLHASGLRGPALEQRVTALVEAR